MNPKDGKNGQDKSQSDAERKPQHSRIGPVAVWGFFVFSWGGAMNYFGSKPEILYLPAVATCMLIGYWTHRFVKDARAELSTPAAALVSPSTTPDHAAPMQSDAGSSEYLAKLISAARAKDETEKAAEKTERERAAERLAALEEKERQKEAKEKAEADARARKAADERPTTLYQQGKPVARASDVVVDEARSVAFFAKITHAAAYNDGEPFEYRSFVLKQTWAENMSSMTLVNGENLGRSFDNVTCAIIGRVK